MAVYGSGQPSSLVVRPLSAGSDGNGHRLLSSNLFLIDAERKKDILSWQLKKNTINLEIWAGAEELSDSLDILLYFDVDLAGPCVATLVKSSCA